MTLLTKDKWYVCLVGFDNNIVLNIVIRKLDIENIKSNLTKNMYTLCLMNKVIKK